jgi:hypothetical protein
VGVLGYFPIFYTLARGWICFIFNWHEDMMEVFHHAWGWGLSRLVPKEWLISFDPTHDIHSPSKVWVILPNLSLAFLHEEVLVAIGN